MHPHKGHKKHGHQKQDLSKTGRDPNKEDAEKRVYQIRSMLALCNCLARNLRARNRRNARRKVASAGWKGTKGIPRKRIGKNMFPENALKIS